MNCNELQWIEVDHGRSTLDWRIQRLHQVGVTWHSKTWRANDSQILLVTEMETERWRDGRKTVTWVAWVTRKKTGLTSARLVGSQLSCRLCGFLKHVTTAWGTSTWGCLANIANGRIFHFVFYHAWAVSVISYVFFSWSSWHWADFIGRPYLVAYLVMSSLWDPSKDGKNREIVRELRVFKGRSVRCSRQIFLWNLCWGASSSTCWQRCVGHQRPKVGLLEGQFREPKAFIQYTQYIPYTMLQLL